MERMATNSTVGERMKKKRYFGRFTLTVLAAFFALWFLMPTVLTISNSFMKDHVVPQVLPQKQHHDDQKAVGAVDPVHRRHPEMGCI